MQSDLQRNVVDVQERFRVCFAAEFSAGNRLRIGKHSARRLRITSFIGKPRRFCGINYFYCPLDMNEPFSGIGTGWETPFTIPR